MFYVIFFLFLQIIFFVSRVEGKTNQWGIETLQPRTPTVFTLNSSHPHTNFTLLPNDEDIYFGLTLELSGQFSRASVIATEGSDVVFEETWSPSSSQEIDCFSVVGSSPNGKTSNDQNSPFDQLPSLCTLKPRHFNRRIVSGDVFLEDTRIICKFEGFETEDYEAHLRATYLTSSDEDWDSVSDTEYLHDMSKSTNDTSEFLDPDFHQNITIRIKNTLVTTSWAPPLTASGNICSECEYSIYVVDVKKYRKKTKKRNVKFESLLDIEFNGEQVVEYQKDTTAEIELDPGMYVLNVVARHGSATNQILGDVKLYSVHDPVVLEVKPSTSGKFLAILVGFASVVGVVVFLALKSKWSRRGGQRLGGQGGSQDPNRMQPMPIV